MKLQTLYVEELNRSTIKLPQSIFIYINGSLNKPIDQILFITLPQIKERIINSIHEHLNN
jgi:hypothetical protein